MEEDNRMSCCNIYIWNAICIFIFCFAGMDTYFPKVHTVYAIIIGLALILLYFIMTQIKILKSVLKVVTSVCWGFGWSWWICDILSLDNTWLWFLRVILTLIFFGLHLFYVKPSANSEDEELFDDDNSSDIIKYFNIQKEAILEKKKTLFDKVEIINNFGIADVVFAKKCNLHQERYDDSVRQVQNTVNAYDSRLLSKEKAFKQIDLICIAMTRDIDATIELADLYLERYKKHNEQAAKKSEEPSFNPFSGCNDVASLKKRYKELSKSFHPDMQGGDNQSMQYINAEYERLLKKFQNT